MNSGNQFLKSKDLIANDCTEFIISFEDGRKVNLGDLLMEYSKVNYERSGELREQLSRGHEYLMTVQGDNAITVDDSLEAFGFGRDGLQSF